uniref:Uncharacterized protein n=1 Tax=Anguilla anguilla TaxID=7936 RepID=A0A0E9QHR7_ANGAN
MVTGLTHCPCRRGSVLPVCTVCIVYTELEPLGFLWP